jgi:hypothetical protein
VSREDSVVQPREIIESIAKPTADLGAASYFAPATLARGKELGLDGFRFYFLGRGGVLGDVEPDVVLSAFGYFEPALLATMWNSAKAKVDPRTAAREYLACAADFGRDRFAELPGLDAYADAAAAVVAAVDVGALPLFAGVRAEPVPEDAPARAMHHTVLLRELRGSAHLVAVASVGLPTKIAHAIKRPTEVELFGWKDVPEVTDEHRALHARADEMTNDMLVPSFSVLDDAGGRALVDGTHAMHAALTAAA